VNKNLQTHGVKRPYTAKPIVRKCCQKFW